MPPFDEEGNPIGMDGFKVCDKDGNPIQLSAATILMCAPEAEHDYLPPFDDVSRSFVLSGKAAEKLAEMFDEFNRRAKRASKRERRERRLLEKLRRKVLKNPDDTKLRNTYEFFRYCRKFNRAVLNEIKNM